MISVNGYFDGSIIRTLEKLNTRKLKLEEAAENDEQIAIIEETAPGFIHYFYPPTQFSKDKCVVLPVMREDRVVEYGVGTFP